MFYYAVYSREDHKYHLWCEALVPYLMCGDYLLFDSADECISYWASEGIEVIADA